VDISNNWAQSHNILGRNRDVEASKKSAPLSALVLVRLSALVSAVARILTDPR
jgi:hypothetical protein